jgi:aspartyl-tRNA synthetase
VVLVRAGALRLVIQSSMNFNINRRFEHFSVEDEPELFAHWEELTRWMVAHTPAGLEAANNIKSSKKNQAQPASDASKLS